MGRDPAGGREISAAQYQNPQTRIESKDKPKHGTVNTILLVLNAASLEQAVEHCKNELSFSQRWQWQFDLNDKEEQSDTRLDYLKQHYQL